MALSRDYTAITLYRAAARMLHQPQNNPTYTERFVLINEAIDSVIGLFFDLLAPSYMTYDTIVAGGATGNYSTNVASAAWTGSTQTMSGITMFVALDAATHTGWWVTMRTGGSNVYTGTISQITSTTSFVLSGNNLPTANIPAGNINDVVMSATPPTGNSASLVGLRIMRVGQELKFELESTATKQIRLGTKKDVFKWQSSAAQNLNTIIWAVEGDTIYLNKGDSVSTYATLTLGYPRVPLRVTQNSSPIDVPDGVPISLVIAKLKSLMAERLKVPVPDYAKELAGLIQQLYVAYGRQASIESVKKQASALM